MFCFEKYQLKVNKNIAKQNRKYILHKLEEYYEIVNVGQTNCKEEAILAYWQAKKQNRLDNLNRLISKNPANPNRI